jgi:hypothetical protein
MLPTNHSTMMYTKLTLHRPSLRRSNHNRALRDTTLSAMTCEKKEPFDRCLARLGHIYIIYIYLYTFHAQLVSVRFRVLGCCGSQSLVAFWSSLSVETCPCPASQSRTTKPIMTRRTPRTSSGRWTVAVVTAPADRENSTLGYAGRLWVSRKQSAMISHAPFGPFPYHFPFGPLEHTVGQNIARQGVQSARCDVERHLALSSLVFDQDGESA